MKTGDKVLCRFYNTPEGKFYGEYWEGEVIAVLSGDKPFLVSQKARNPLLPDIRLHRKEIKRTLSRNTDAEPNSRSIT